MQADENENENENENEDKDENEEEEEWLEAKSERVPKAPPYGEAIVLDDVSIDT